MNGIRTITLDLDDTLWEIHPVIRRAERVLRAWMTEHYPRIVEMYAREDVMALRCLLYTSDAADEYQRV